MKEQLISFETAKLAKSKGFGLTLKDFFNWFQQYYYNNEGGRKDINQLENSINSSYLCVTQSLLQKWLRDKHQIDVCIVKQVDKYLYVSYIAYISQEANNIKQDLVKLDRYLYKYEDMLEIGLLEGLKLIK